MKILSHSQSILAPRLVLVGAVAFLFAITTACSKKEEPPAPPPAPQSPTAGLFNSDKTTAIGRAVDVASQVAASKVTASELYKNYSAQLTTIESGMASVKSVVDKAGPMLPAGVTAKYQEITQLLPELKDTVASLKNYDAEGPTDLATKLQTDFDKVTKLYGELKAMIPASLMPKS